jgi:membrane protease YdiL (CAAX protease family)
MNQPATIALGAIIMVVLAATGLVWRAIALRWRRGIPLVPYQHRRRVRWQGADVLLVVLFYILAMILAMCIVPAILGPEKSALVPCPEEERGDNPVLQLLRQGPAWAVAAAVLVAVVVAPVTEEFLFRALLQGWLEAAWRRRRGFLGTMPVLLSSLVFAGMHLRAADEERHQVEYLVAMLAAQTAVSLLTIAFAAVWLRFRVGATPRDFGWSPGHLAGDVRLGLAAFAAIALPIYVMAFYAKQWLPAGKADTVPLLFFALALGLLYFRTHRLTPSIVLHIALNSTSLVAFWLTGGG